MAALLQLGAHQFEVAPLSYSQLQSRAEFRWPALDRLGREPALQFLGPGEKRITISGLIFPEAIGGWNRFRAFERSANAGQPMLMVLGTGHIFGRVVITAIGEVHDHIGYAGLPRKLSFDIEVARYGGDYGGFSGWLF
jgi:uncharacterized protein